jgi:uncharacterized membrane protein
MDIFKNIPIRIVWLQEIVVTFFTARKKWHIWVLAGLFFVMYFHLALMRHWHFESNGYDLGIFDQAIWKYSQFKSPYITVHSKNILGEHFHPILIALAPVYWLIQRAEVLLFVQALALSVAAIPVYLFAKKRVEHIPALLLSFSYLVFWGVQLTNNYDFHEVSIAVPFIAMAIYTADAKKWRWYYVAIIFMLLCKENMSLLLVGMAFWLLTQKQYVHALSSFVVGSVWFYVVVNYLIPKFSGSVYGFWYYSKLGANAGEAITTMLTKPLSVFSILTDLPVKKRTLLLLFLPFLFLVFLSPLLFVLAPLILERFLSDTENLWVANYHYNATIAPVLAMAAADTIRRISLLVRHKEIRPKLILALSLLIAFAGAYATWNRGFPLSAYAHPKRLHLFSLTQSQKDGHDAVKVIPQGSSVSAQDPIIPHLSHRDEIYELTLRKKTDYYVRGREINVWPLKNDEELDEIFVTREKEGYVRVFDREGWVVLKRPGL